MNRTVAHIGDAISRIDARAKVTGQARYAAEYAAPGLLYGWVVSSPIARGRIVGIDDRACRALPGVVEVITHLNRAQVALLDMSHEDQVAPPGSPFRPLHDERIVFSQQPVALVVAQTLEAARDAATLLRIDYETAAHNTDFEVALADKFEPRRKRAHFEMPKSRGDALKAMTTSSLAISTRMRMPTHHHNPMEPHAATVVWEGEGRITVYDKNQGSQNVQAYLASVFGLSKKDVRVVNTYVGGAFGSGLRPHYHVHLAVLAARMLRRSVRVVLTRQQMFSHVHRPPAVQKVSLGCDARGRLQAIVNDASTATSRHEHYMEVVCNWGLMAYASPNATAQYTLAEIDTATPGDMRAPGAATGMTLFEMAIDEMASAAGMDPLEFRRLNDAEREAMSDKPYTSKSLREAWLQGAARFGWARRSAAPRSMREGGELIGWGMASGMWEASFMKTSARARFTAEGVLEVCSATSDIGTGMATVMAQVASQTLDLPLGRVRVLLGDSSLPDAPVEGGSWAAASTGAAVQLACQALAEKLLRAAAKVPGRPLGDARMNDIAWRAGQMVVRADPERAVSFEEVLRASGQAMLEAEETARPGVGGMISMLRKARHAHSAIFCEVRVDEELLQVRVKRIVIAVAAGRIINPKTARSQILGGVVMGIGMALHEESLMDHRLGRFMNHSLAEYHLPTQADIDGIEVIFVDESDPEVSPLGVKGLGEIGIVGTAAAVVNAIFHATGRRVRELPATIDKLLPEPL